MYGVVGALQEQRQMLASLGPRRNGLRWAAMRVPKPSWMRKNAAMPLCHRLRSPAIGRRSMVFSWDSIGHPSKCAGAQAWQGVLLMLGDLHLCCLPPSPQHDLILQLQPHLNSMSRIR